MNWREQWASDARSLEDLVQAALTEPDEDAASGALYTLSLRTNFDDLHRRRQDCASQDERTRSLAARELSRLGLPEDMVPAALAHPDDDTVWEAVTICVRNRTQTIFEQARQLSASEIAHERQTGASILGQIGHFDEAIQEEAVTLLLGLLNQEQDPNVLNAVAVALWQRDDQRAIAPLVHLKNHPHEEVRFGVVQGLLGKEEERAIQALVALSADEDTDVRDWATFGLGSMIDTDTPAIREALVARLTDEDSNTRAEAMMGLAHRHDQRAVEPLVAHLKDGWYSGVLFEAAGELGDPRLYPVLVQWRDEWDEERTGALDEDLEEAIEKCRPLP